MKILSIFLLPLIIISTPVIAQQKLVRERLFRDGVGIASECVVMPVGRVLLISRDDFIGAVKFFPNEERPDGTYSKYECFEYERLQFRMLREGEVSFRKSSSGFWAKMKGFLSFHENPFKMAGPPLKFNNFSLFAVAGGGEHSTVYFWSAPNVPDLKVRMAPTPWREIEEIDLSDPRIKWFGYDDKESWNVIAIDKLWKLRTGSGGRDLLDILAIPLKDPIQFPSA